MGFFADYSGSPATHLLYKAAFIFAVTKWVLSWTLRLIKGIDVGLFSFPSGNSHSSSDSLQQTLSICPFSSASSSSLVTSKVIRDSIGLSTFGATIERLPESCDTCAVCLDPLRERDQVSLLSNCFHVFHRPCLDRWLDHDVHKTCPLCRAPLLTTISSSSPDLSRSQQQQQQPSWTVEQLLYLFGDDLLL